MRYLIVIVLTGMVLLSFSQELRPQEQILKTEKNSVILAASWSTGLPMGEMTTYARMTSGRGFQFEINQMIDERWTYGGTFGWQTFFEKGEVWYIGENSVMSGIRRNYINSFALLGSTRYYFPTSVNGIKAYLNLEAGASVIENYEIFGLYEYKELEWYFSLVPGMGIDIPINNKLGVQVFFKYPNSFKTNSSIHYSWLNIGIGMYFKVAD